MGDCRNPEPHGPHDFLADSDAIALSPCRGSSGADFVDSFTNAAMVGTDAKPCDYEGMYGTHAHLADDTCYVQLSPGTVWCCHSGCAWSATYSTDVHHALIAHLREAHPARPEPKKETGGGRIANAARSWVRRVLRRE